MKSNTEWKLWGKTDPLWGVASWPGRERSGKNPWTDREFYALGSDWQDFRQAWRRSTGYRPGTLLEIGCGAGRITAELANEFEQVIATDVSADILDYARERIRAVNIRWQITEGDTIPAAADSVDAVFSCHVFQHFPDNSAQLDTFKEIWRVLRNDGSFLIHLPVHMFPQENMAFSTVARGLYSVYGGLTAFRAGVCRFLIRAGVKWPYMHGISYELPKLLAELHAIGFADVGAAAIVVKSGGLHCCVSGRKPGNVVKP